MRIVNVKLKDISTWSTELLSKNWVTERTKTLRKVSYIWYNELDTIISYQLHRHRSETWTCVDGEGIFVLDGERSLVKGGDVMNIPLGHHHAIKAITDLTFIEVQIGNPLVEEDIERFEFKW